MLVDPKHGFWFGFVNLARVFFLFNLAVGNRVHFHFLTLLSGFKSLRKSLHIDAQITHEKTERDKKQKRKIFPLEMSQ